MKRLVISTVLAAGVVLCSQAAVTTVAANETVTVTDANAADYADGFAFADATGVIEFETSAAPTMNITGRGTVKKTYNGDWTMTKAIENFTGTYDLCGSGIVSFDASYMFGNNDSTAKLYVRDGATLRFAAKTAKLWSRTLRVAGMGAPGAKAALMFDSAETETDGGTIRNLVLDADASIHIIKNGNFFYSSGTFNLNGHKLFHSGPGIYTAATSHTMKNGEIVTYNDGTGMPTFCFRTAKVDKDSPVRFVRNGTTKFQMSDKTLPPPTAEMWITGASTFQVVDNWNSGWWDWTTNSLGWAGPIVFTNETGMSSMTLDMAGSSTPQRQINFLGPISGNGRLILSPNADKTRVCLGNANNTFTGGLYWNGEKKGSARLLPLHPGSIPDYSSVTCNYGHIDCVFDAADTEAPWDFAHFRELANSATWLNSSFAAIVGAGGDGEIAPITFGSSITNPIGANAVVTLTGSDEGSFSNLTWLCGTARILGPGKYNVGALRIPNGTKTIGTNTYSAVVELDGGVEFVTASNATRIGYNPVSDASKIARLKVKNAFLHAPDDIPRDFNAGHHYALAVGCDGSDYGGILEVCDGAVVSNKLLVSGWGAAAGGGDGRGMVIQRGGKVYSLGATVQTHFGSGVGMKGHGTYIMHGGEFTAFASFHIGGYCMGNWTQFGGTAVFTNYPGRTEKTFTASSLNRGWGEIYLAGGTMAFYDSFSLASGSISDSQHCKLVIDGPDAFFDTHGSVLRTSVNSGKQLAQVAVRNGGTLRTSGTRKTMTSSIYTITFDGGTFLCGANGREIFCYPNENTAVNYAQAPNLVAVFSGGMTIDTGASTNNYTGVAITGATGGGISQVPFDGPISGADGLVQPYVDIAGDGLGATAVALFDTESCAVTNIIVTCPGVEYTTATALVYVAKNLKKTIVLDDYIVPNENTGGFTKSGDHDFTLKATNTWGGATTVAGGTLIAGVDWAIPPNTDICLSGGGILDFNSKTGEVATVTYGAGGGSIVNASKVKIEDNSIFFKISVDDLLAGKTIPWTGDLDYSRANLTVTGDLSRLVAGTRYHVVTVTDGEATGTLTLASDDPPSGWEYRVTSKGVKIAEVKGSAIVIR